MRDVALHVRPVARAVAGRGAPPRPALDNAEIPVAEAVPRLVNGVAAIIVEDIAVRLVLTGVAILLVLGVAETTAMLVVAHLLVQALAAVVVMVAAE